MNNRPSILKKICNLYETKEIKYTDKYLVDDGFYEINAFFKKNASLKVLLLPLSGSNGCSYQMKVILKINIVNDFEDSSGTFYCINGCSGESSDLSLINLDVGKWVGAIRKPIIETDDYDFEILGLFQLIMSFFEDEDGFCHRLLSEMESNDSKLEWEDRQLFEGYLYYLTGKMDVAILKFKEYSEVEKEKLSKNFIDYPSVIEEEKVVENCKLEKRIDFLKRKNNGDVPHGRRTP
ncbi:MULTISPECIES: hypothetical protein [unclassified Neptuniibacter]|uniref:hypothetical protein n=1 Tax=unclassified Neptuniibacter TaxID=2630693 RepID=UPI000C455AD6|nr:MULTISPECIES: hypothetical protein [unclassified Neptuniibacter]MAY42520.1 hypothetical protein [Oceanospirillaceae bacterium]|tara:strand:+ start:30032 stop:30739 length:708 start_codon:yes stop_codon:yes gene_type:complete